MTIGKPQRGGSPNAHVRAGPFFRATQLRSKSLLQDFAAKKANRYVALSCW
jgi:hypothetical protein